jgi:hypothetical protein
MSDSFNGNYDLSNFLHELGFDNDNDNDNDSKEEDFSRVKAKIGKKKYRKSEAWVVANEFGDLKEFDDYKQFIATVSNHSRRFKKWSQDKIVYPLLPCSVSVMKLFLLTLTLIFWLSTL